MRFHRVVDLFELRHDGVGAVRPLGGQSRTSGFQLQQRRPQIGDDNRLALQQQTQHVGGAGLRRTCTTAPPRLPRRTDTRPSVSRIRSASRSDTRLTLNCSTSTSWRGSKSPSARAPSMIWRRNSSATISAIRGADKRRRASGPIPSAVIRFQQRNERTEPRPLHPRTPLLQS